MPSLKLCVLLWVGAAAQSSSCTCTAKTGSTFPEACDGVCPGSSCSNSFCPSFDCDFACGSGSSSPPPSPPPPSPSPPASSSASSPPPPSPPPPSPSPPPPASSSAPSPTAAAAACVANCGVIDPSVCDGLSESFCSSSFCTWLASGSVVLCPPPPPPSPTPAPLALPATKPTTECPYWKIDEHVGICEWKQKCVSLCGDNLWNVSGVIPTNFRLSYSETVFGLSGTYSCWCCDISGTVSTDENVFAGQGSIFETVEEGTPAPPPPVAPPIKNDLDLSGLPTWVWVFSFLLPVVYLVASKLLTLGLPAIKIYAYPGGLSMMRALRGKGVSWTTLMQMQTEYLEVVKKADGSEHWRVVGWFPGLAAEHELLAICFGDANELSKRARVAKIMFSVLLASALSIAFGSTQLKPSSDCRYDCTMVPQTMNPLALQIYGQYGLTCELDIFSRDAFASMPGDPMGDEAESTEIELPSGYLSTTGLLILLINQLYGTAIYSLLKSATRKGRASKNNLVITLSVVVVLATGIIAVIAAYLYLERVGSCPGEDGKTVVMSVANTTHMSGLEFAANFLYGCASDGTTSTVYTDPCTASCNPVPPTEKLRVCVLGAVIGLAIDWFAYKPLVQGTGLYFLAKFTTKLDSFHMKPTIEVEQGKKAKKGPKYTATNAASAVSAASADVVEARA